MLKSRLDINVYKVKKSYVNKVVQRVLMLKPKLNINVNKIEHGGISVET